MPLTSMIADQENLRFGYGLTGWTLFGDRLEIRFPCILTLEHYDAVVSVALVDHLLA